MFGYVRVLEGELLVREYKLYRGVYCGLCRCMGKHSGRLSTVSLSYDFVFLALLRAALNGEPFSVRMGKCGLHPFKKRPVCEESSALRYCAGAAAVLNYHKLLDDLHDKDKSLPRRIIIRLLLPFAKRHLKRSFKAFPEYSFATLAEDVKESLCALSDLEIKNASADACADAFGHVLSAVFSHGITDKEKRSIADKVGYHIGRWIYLADAVDDFDKDIKSGSFNPLYASGYSVLPTKLLSDCLTMELGAAYDTLNKLEFRYSDIRSIVYNTVTLGLPARAEAIFGKAITKTDRAVSPPEERNGL